MNTPAEDGLLNPSNLLVLDEETLSFYVANWRRCLIVKNLDDEVARLDRAEATQLRDWLNEVLA